jgi:hypothetical protein
MGEKSRKEKWLANYIGANEIGRAGLPPPSRSANKGSCFSGNKASWAQGRRKTVRAAASVGQWRAAGLGGQPEAGQKSVADGPALVTTLR